MDEATVPRDLDAVTPGWLTGVLRQRYTGVTVTSVTVGPVITSFATNARLLLDYDETGHRHRLPPTMFLKSTFGRNESAAALRSAFVREAAFFDHVAGDVPVHLPASFAVVTDADSGRSALLLEDLLARNCAIGRPDRPLTPGQAMDGLLQLAALHAHQWDSADLAQVDAYPGTLRPLVLSLLSEEVWTASLTRPAGRFIPEPLRASALVRAATERMWELGAAGPRCLIHGDPHLGNTYTEPGGSIGFLDWQACSGGSWAYDVSRYLISGLSVADRRDHEHELLGGYLAELGRLGVAAPGQEAAWLAYRRHILHGLRWVCSPIGNYPEHWIERYLERFGTAATDHNALASLGLDPEEHSHHDPLP